MNAAPPAIYVRTAAELADAMRALSDSDHIALDTEFMRESTYYPKLCLIQAGSASACFLIDPLVLDVTPFLEFVAERPRIKVLHSARQDLEVLSALPDGGSLSVPGPIFDTQIAAALLGHTAQIGYGALVEQRLGLTLAKGHTRTDWSRRPLSDEQLQYAADDARYLTPLYQELRNELASAGRLNWLLEECAALEDSSAYRVEPQDAWRRLKGLERLRPEQRQAAKALAAWRETMAVTRDKPRGWILTDESLRELAERLPSTSEQLERMRTLPPALIRKRGTELLALIESARAEAVGEEETAPKRPDPQQLSLVNRLMEQVRSTAQECRVSPELLATRRMIEQLVFSGKSEALLKGWRREVIGERLVALASP